MILQLCLLFGLAFCMSDAVCSFPSNIQNKNFTSTNFGTMKFEVQTVNFTATIGTQTTIEQWICHVASDTKYVLKSSSSIFSASLQTGVYTYYCLDLREQSSDAYLYYLLGDGPDNRFQNISDTATVAEACAATVDTAEYEVMINADSPENVKNYCASPLLGDFIYACSASSMDNGTLSICNSTSPQYTLVFDHTSCAATVLFSTSGILNCVAQTSADVSSQTVYYQTVYNTDSGVIAAAQRFTCMAVSDINGTIYFTYTQTKCSAGQTAQSGGTAFEPLESTDLCPLPEEEVTQVAESSNLGLILGLVLGLLLPALIAAALLAYFCWFKRNPNAGKPIVENTKPRFEDPDKETVLEDIEEDTRSTPLTRDEITFEAISPTLMPNGKLANGHVVTSSPTNTQPGSFYPSGVANGSVRRDSGIGTSKSMDRPTPRIGLNPSRESMVIFNGDEKVISGNDTRVVPNTNPAHAFKMDNSMAGAGVLTLEGLEADEQDDLGELSPHIRDERAYPSLPREKSNLMPPIETVDPEKEKAK